MSYYLLTGATGLLGNYLLRDLLRSGVPIAVVARASRRMTARQRIENLLRDWEENLGESLPRPVVLQGDIVEPDLGLDGCSLRWLAEHCSGIIHNAASLSFIATSQDGEPYRSNVEGTRHVLELARSLEVREFHHVSTAYIAGLRSGVVYEHEVDVGQELCNDYERSKLTAELMVHAAEDIPSRTIYRPGIIIGDSQTGFTTTYHGFYAALQLAHTIVQAYPADETGLVGGHVVRLALDGEETKHLVPVDWVSAVMTHIILHPRWHGRTYHLTPKHPVTTRQIRDVLEAAAGFYGTVFTGAGKRPEACSEPEDLFYEHIRVYNSYWRMDPSFDRTNTELAAPHLPCPEVDRQLLLRLSRIVIERNFPTPSKKPPELAFDADEWLRSSLGDSSDRSVSLDSTRVQTVFGLNVLGPGGGQWHFYVQDDRIVLIDVGIHPQCTKVYHTESRILHLIAQGELSWGAALKAGKVIPRIDNKTRILGTRSVAPSFFTRDDLQFLQQLGPMPSQQTV